MANNKNILPTTIEEFRQIKAAEGESACRNALSELYHRDHELFASIAVEYMKNTLEPRSAVELNTRTIQFNIYNCKGCPYHRATADGEFRCCKHPDRNEMKYMTYRTIPIVGTLPYIPEWCTLSKTEVNLLG